MVNLGDAPVNDYLELTSEDSSSSTGVENLEFVELLYGWNLSSSQIHLTAALERGVRFFWQ